MLPSVLCENYLLITDVDEAICCPMPASHQTLISSLVFFYMESYILLLYTYIMN